MAGPKQTQTSNESINSTTQVTPYGDSQGLLKSILKQAQSLPTGITGAENLALGGLTDVARGISNQFANPLGNVAGNLLQGGGFGQGVDALKQNYQTAVDAYNPVASGQYLDQNNPYLQGLLSQVTDNARNAVGSAFAAGGRSFSGAHAGALGKAITNATAPILFDQYNRERQAQMDAAGNLFNTGVNFSGALDASQGNRVNARLQAPGVINSLSEIQGAPFQQQLAAEAYKRNVPAQALAQQLGLILPVAQGFGTQTTSGRSTGKAVTEQESDPFQTALGGGLGLLGLLSMGPTGGLGGALGSSLAGGILG